MYMIKYCYYSTYILIQQVFTHYQNLAKFTYTYIRQVSSGPVTSNFMDLHVYLLIFHFHHHFYLFSVPLEKNANKWLDMQKESYIMHIFNLQLWRSISNINRHEWFAWYVCPNPKDNRPEGMHNRQIMSAYVTTTVENRLSDSHLSIPSIIWSDVQKFLKQVIPNFWARDPLLVVK